MSRIFLALAACVAVSCARRETHDHGHGHGHGEHGHDAPEAARGPHGGRLLEGDGLTLEMTIYEPGIPPQSRVYAYDGRTPVPPRQVELTVELRRFDRTDVLRYAAQEDYLVGDKVVEEPHSFDVHVAAKRGGKTFTWSYPSYEGRTTIAAAAARGAGIVVDQAGPRKLRDRVRLHGRLRLNEEQVAHASPRYGGTIRELRKRIGDDVAAGETLALVESSETLQSFAVTSAVAGKVLQRNKTVGEVAAAGETLYVVAGLRSVWADLALHPLDAARVRTRQVVHLVADDPTAATVTGALSYVAPVATESNQTLLARATLPNPEGALRPGMFVSADVVVAEAEAPVVVRASAVQRFRDWDVVFRTKDDVYEIAIVELGLRDDEWVEVVSGLSAGEAYVAENAFVVKAEIGKSGATHDH